MLPTMPFDILKVNLTDGKITKEKIEDISLIKKYIGGRGIATHLLLNELEADMDPYDDRTSILFAPGVLTGTPTPCSGRTSILFKSPATGKFFKTNVGGHFGAQLKFAGYDLLIVNGKAKKPVYIYIEDDYIEIKDADFLWNKDVRESNYLIRQVHDDPQIQTVCIGQAGENKVAYASIQASIYNAAGRGGGGALMGDKNLKAIAVKGSKGLKIANPERYFKSLEKLYKKMNSVPGVQPLSDFGTSIGVESTNTIGAFPMKNFQEGSIDDARPLTGQYLVEGGFLKRKVSCYSCPVACHRFATVDSGKYRGTYTGGPEYETINAFGGCGTANMALVIKAGELCNIYGLDVISTGGCIQWLMECWQRGLITKEEADGLDLSWGNEDTIIELTKKIAHREGIGDLLAKGTKLASEEFGKDSYKWAIQARGLEQSRVETRSAFAYALAFAISSRGPDHLNTETLAEFGGDSEAIRVIKDITGSEEYAYPYTTDKRAEIVRWHEDIYAASDCTGICAFPTTAQFWVGEEDIAELFSSTTGIEMTADEVMNAGKRIITMERIYNGILGHSRKDDLLPWRLMNEKLKGAMHDNAINSAEMLDFMKDEYFQLHKWNMDTGLPTKETMEKLGLDEFIEKASNYFDLS